MDVRGKKVLVGLSGGVDSAVSAALLKQAGANVTGVFIKGWYPPGMPCSWASDRRDAMRVAARLHIPFETLDASKEYKKYVIDYLLSEYRAGRTPNPDIMCNKEIKFGVFYQYAKKAGAHAIATGHYVNGEKDQRYFLWAVPKHILEETIFPVGQKNKFEVRTLAKKFKLPVADKKDSQGICFLGTISIEEFLKNEFGVHEGDAFDVAKNLVGRHDGALLYTLGERVSLTNAHEAGPWFVQAKDIARNNLIVSKVRIPPVPQKEKGISFIGANWFNDASTVTSAQYRYRGPQVKGHIEGDRFMPIETLPEPVAPGQSLVFYHNKELIGGGMITA